MNACKWVIEIDYGDTYSTSCGEMFTIIDGTPADNGMKYCPFCGNVILEGNEDEFYPQYAYTEGH